MPAAGQFVVAQVVSTVALVVAIVIVVAAVLVIMAMIVVVAVIVIMAVVVIVATRDDRSSDGIENQRTRIRLVLEVEHVVERICIAVDRSGPLGRRNRAIDEAELP